MSDASSSPHTATTGVQPADEYPWGKLAAVLVVLGDYLVVPFVTQALPLLVLALFGWSGSRISGWVDTAEANFISILLMEIFAISVLYLFASAWKRADFLRVAGFRGFRWGQLFQAVSGLAAYLVLFIVTYAVVNRFVPLDADAQQDIGFSTSVQGIGLVMAFLSLVVIVPLSEEIIFRGFLYGTFRNRGWGAVPTTAAVSALFAALHLFGSVDGSLLWIAFVDVFALSLVLAYLREKNNSIWAGVALHVLKNGFTFFNLFVLASR